jgi:hypothetical protein
MLLVVIVAASLGLVVVVELCLEGVVLEGVLRGQFLGVGGTVWRVGFYELLYLFLELGLSLVDGNWLAARVLRGLAGCDG